MNLTIIIVSWNVCHLLEDCLASIYSQESIHNINVVVVDNASTDGTIKMIRASFPRVNLIANQINKGFASANNQGLRVATGEYVLYLNPDTVVFPGTLDKCLSYLQNSRKTGALGCRIENSDGSVQYSCRSFPSVWSYFVEAFFLHRVFPGFAPFGRFYGSAVDYSKTQEADVVLGAFLMVRKELVDSLGGFDERFRMYSEETDLCYRIKRKSRKVVYYSEASILHYGGRSTKQDFVNMFLEDHKSRLLFMLKHFSWPRTVVSEMLIFVCVSLRLPFWLVISLIDYVLNRSSRNGSIQKLQIFWTLFLWYLHFGNLKLAIQAAKET